MKLRTLLRTVPLLAVLVLGSFAQKQNPYSVWCDYHSTNFSKKGQEFPNGVCYDVYTHTYWDISTKSNRTHKMTMRCPK